MGSKLINLTPRQVQAVRFIRVYRESQGAMPNYTEMMSALGISSKGRMSRLMQSLEQRGAVKRNSKRARDFDLIDETSISLNQEICRLVDKYASEQRIGRETAANELLRMALGAGA